MHRAAARRARCGRARPARIEQFREEHGLRRRVELLPRANRVKEIRRVSLRCDVDVIHARIDQPNIEAKAGHLPRTAGAEELPRFQLDVLGDRNALLYGLVRRRIRVAVPIVEGGLGERCRQAR